MSQRTRRADAASRAEARRRARLTARGMEPDDELDEDETPAASAQPGLLTRLFPPAPPLPDKPDPLAGYTYEGPFGGVVQTLYLLNQRPLVWGGFGVLWALTYFATFFSANSFAGVIFSMVSFGSLIAAGWMGWQRPWAYGLAAALLGYVLYGIGVFTILFPFVPDYLKTGENVGSAATSLVMNGVLQLGVGALAGFYGGYLRRRLAESRPSSANGSRRRR